MTSKEEVEKLYIDKTRFIEKPNCVSLDDCIKFSYERYIEYLLSNDYLTWQSLLFLKKSLKDLERLEKLEKVFSDLKSMFEITLGIDCGNEYFIEIKQSDSGISELIPQEDIKIFKEVLECQKD